MPIESALRKFASSIKAKMTQLTSGDPEDQLRAPFEEFMNEAGASFGPRLICTGNTRLPDRLGIPDYALHVNRLLIGYAELKAPGVGVTANRFKGHNRDQFHRFSTIPNIIYSDGNEWALYRDGQLQDKVVRLAGDVTSHGKGAVADGDAEKIERLLREFLAWEPIIPTGRGGKIDFKQLPAILAPLCRMLRDDVIDAIKDSGSPLVQLARDWRQLLFPYASDGQFADAYAQTVTFALLLARSETEAALTLDTAIAGLAADHSLLSRALQVLTDPNARVEISASLDLLLRVIGAIPPAAFTGIQNPWLYFYEDFLAVYDPKLRKNIGVYYTPPEVVHAQVRLIDDLLVRRLGKPLGFAEPSVITLDPAAGTGTYLLGVIEHALSRVEDRYGKGAVAGYANELASNLYGFELMVGPYAVCELRVSRALQDRGAALPKGGNHVYLTDTLENPHTEPVQPPLFLQPIAEQHAKALKVKSSVPVIVCLGNPPYDRHEAAARSNQAITGSWVRWGDKGDGSDAILMDFIRPAAAAGHGIHIKNLYNLYVYFWRWALWKVLEHETAAGPGVISLISASSYLDGDAFSGMREHMRRVCDEIWILDLGGEGRGTRRTENVFAIQTPVAIALAVRTKKLRADNPAKAHYARIEGTRDAKLAALNAIEALTSLQWQDCPAEWQAPFRPSGKGDYFDYPLLTDLMPWQHSGAQFKRTWPIAPNKELLKIRWRRLLNSSDRAMEFRESRDRKISSECVELPNSIQGDEQPKRLPPLNQIHSNAPVPRIEQYAYRSFDRQWIIADSRVGDFIRPELWRAHSDKQIYITTLLYHPLGLGPAVTACESIPDLHYFSGRGAKDIIPLYRNSDASDANLLPGILELLRAAYGFDLTPEDFVAYVYGVLAHPAFTSFYGKELETRKLCVPVTKDAALFKKVRDTGAGLLWLHTYGQRFVPTGHAAGHIPEGSARCTIPVPSDAGHYPEHFEYNESTRVLHVGEGAFAPVERDAFEFEVSGLKVVHSWLRYRMKEGAGRQSSPLDKIRPERWTSQFTTELLELLWILEKTLAGYPEQERLFKAVIAGECLKADELPAVPEPMRKAPASRAAGRGLFES